MAKRNIDLLLVHANELIPCEGPATGIAGPALQQLDVLRDAAVAIDAGRIVAIGDSTDLIARHQARHTIDCSGRLVSPGLVDPHSHLLFGGSRHLEHEYKMTQRAPATRLDGGIRYTVARTRETDDETLTRRALADLDAMLEQGTTTLEAKTGYGLLPEDELRLLRLTLALRHDLKIEPTFLALHALPEGWTDRRGDYVAMMAEMLPDVARQVRWCDVFCDPVGFTAAECETLGQRALALGMRLRVHADQFGDAGGAALAARLGAASADHLDHSPPEAIEAMVRAGCVGIYLPGVALHLAEMTPRFADSGLGPAAKSHLPLAVRQAIGQGLIAALSTDYNPGSCPTPSMPMIMVLASRLFRLSYAEIWQMATLNAAASLGLGADRGSLTPGKRADLVIWSVPEHGMVINRFGINCVDTVIADGLMVVRSGRRIEGSCAPDTH
jgi:imidazolonepropionase